MALQTPSYVFGDPLGATVAFVYFTVLAAVIGGVVFHLTGRWLRGLGSGSVGRLQRGLISGTISLGLAGVILGAFYASSLSGFYGLEVKHDHVRLQYILPDRMKEVPLSHIADVSRIPTFKGQWRCVIATSSGRVYYSVHAGSVAVHEAVQSLRRHVATAGGQQSRGLSSARVRE